MTVNIENPEVLLPILIANGWYTMPEKPIENTPIVVLHAKYGLCVGYYVGEELPSYIFTRKGANCQRIRIREDDPEMLAWQHISEVKAGALTSDLPSGVVRLGEFI